MRGTFTSRNNALHRQRRITGWVLLLDYAIVIALAALSAPHYFGHAVGWERLTRHPWDVVAAVFIILSLSASSFAFCASVIARST